MAYPSIELQDTRYLLDRILEKIRDGTSYEYFNTILQRPGTPMNRSLVIDTITADFTHFLERSKGHPTILKSSVKSNPTSTIMAPQYSSVPLEQEPETTLLFSHCTLVKLRISNDESDSIMIQHTGTSPIIDRYTSNRPLKTVCFARIPIRLGLSDDILELIQNIQGKLVTLLFQTLPAKTLHQCEIEPKFPNIHCNVLFLYSKARATDGKRNTSRKL